MSADPSLRDLHRRLNRIRTLDSDRRRRVLAEQAINKEARGRGASPGVTLRPGRPSPAQLIDAAALGESLDALAKLIARLELVVAEARSAPRPEPVPGPRPLTRRQLEILGMVAAGRSTESIARELWLSMPTVRNHVARTLRALDVHSRLEAVARARKQGLL